MSVQRPKSKEFRVNHVNHAKESGVVDISASMSFLGVLQSIGKGFAKGLGWAVKYAVPVEKLTALLFPSVAPAALGAAAATGLIQNAVLQVEQKYAAAGVQNGSGAQKLAEVMLLAEPTVTQLLKQEGINADTPYVNSLVSAVVAILNVQTPPAQLATEVGQLPPAAKAA